MSTLKETQITNNENNDWDPEWSPDGSQIIFLSNRIKMVVFIFQLQMKAMTS